MDEFALASFCCWYILICTVLLTDLVILLSASSTRHGPGYVLENGSNAMTREPADEAGMCCLLALEQHGVKQDDPSS